MIERYLSIARVAQLTIKNCIDYLQRALKPIYRLRTNPLALVYSLILLSSLWVFFCDLMQFWHVDKVCLHVHTYISIYLSVCLIHTCVRAHTHAHTYAPCPPPTHTGCTTIGVLVSEGMMPSLPRQNSRHIPFPTHGYSCALTASQKSLRTANRPI